MFTFGREHEKVSILDCADGDPFLTGVYHDLGRFLERSFQHPLAWECYDLARKLYPNHPLLKDVAEEESALEKAEPQYF